MDQLLCARVEPGDIGLIVIGKGKRKLIESVTKAYRKCCETNSKAVYSVPNRVDAPEKGAKLLFLGISRAQNGFIFVFTIEKRSYEATFRSVNKIGDTKKGIMRIGGLDFHLPDGRWAEPGAGVFQSTPEAYLGLSELLSLERCREDKRVSRCCSVAVVDTDFLIINNVAAVVSQPAANQLIKREDLPYVGTHAQHPGVN